MIARLLAPQPIERLVFLRIALPLAILGFMSSRLRHAPYWIGQRGFAVPDLGGDRAQPLYLAPIPDSLAWLVGAAMVGSGLCVAAGFKTRMAGVVFAATLLYVTFADRLAAFTVSKVSGVLVLALAFSVAGARHGVDAWRAARADPDATPPMLAPGGEVRFFQAFVIALYTASGWCKARREWLERDDILWTHLHDSYQTGFAHLAANTLPPVSWALFQYATLGFEILALVWFARAGTRVWAVGFGIVLHVLIGLMFGPLVWFSTLMIALLLGSFAPLPWLRALVGRLPG